MPRLAWILVFLLTGACTGDETLSAYGAAGKLWQLSSIDGAGFPATASLAFPAPGKIAGQTPCTRFRASQTAPYPWFAAEMPTAAAPADCPGPEQDAETAFLTALQEMTLAEISGDVLILSNEQGREMLFKAAR